jgi:hypothetical protein
MDKIGGVLVATTLVDTDGTLTGPFITIVAAPSVMTHLPPVGENGIIFEDAWDLAVLARFTPLLDMETLVCPLIGAQEGFLCIKKFKPGMVQFLQESGEQMCEQVKFAETFYPCVIFLNNLVTSTTGWLEKCTLNSCLVIKIANVLARMLRLSTEGGGVRTGTTHR